MKKTITLYRGTSEAEVDKLKKEVFTELTWWTNNYESVEYYFEGAVMEMRVVIDTELEDDYVSCEEEMAIPMNMYTYGLQICNYPEGAEWYSFSPSYLNKNAKSYKEITLEAAKKRMPN